MQTPLPTLVVSIHDVSPLTQDKVKAMLGDLRAAGVRQTSLLVIPDHHQKAPIIKDLAFCEWVRSLVAEGHEVVLHGYYHRRPSGGGLGSTLVTEYYTAGEGEFFDLNEAEATARLKKAKGEFAANGLNSLGFIAPAWLLGAEAEQAVRKCGFEYTTRLGTFLDFRGDAVTRSQSLVWSVRSGWRRQVSLLWNRYLFGRLKNHPLMRIGLHPPDWDHAAIRNQVLKLVRVALAGREAITYEGWLGRERAAR